MITWARLRKRSPRLIRSITGMNRFEIESLIPDFSEKIQKHKHYWVVVTENKRQRKTGAGRTPLLNAEDFLVMILFYFRVYTTQDLLGFLFGGNQSWACKWVHRLTPILEATLGSKKQLPIRNKKGRKPIGTVEELLKICPELEFIIDGTERPTQRPKDSENQKSRYSGKKKRHTVKNTVVSDKYGRKVLFVGPSYPGRTHDKKMADEDLPSFPLGSTLWQDTGYQGYLPLGVEKTLQPRKKKKKEKRSESDKLFNREISRTRVRVEHAIGGIKRSNIINDVYRNRKKGFENQVMFVAAGLHNYRMEMRATI